MLYKRFLMIRFAFVSMSSAPFCCFMHDVSFKVCFIHWNWSFEHETRANNSRVSNYYFVTSVQHQRMESIDNQLNATRARDEFNPSIAEWNSLHAQHTHTLTHTKWISQRGLIVCITCEIYKLCYGKCFFSHFQPISFCHLIVHGVCSMHDRVFVGPPSRSSFAHFTL